MPDQELMVGEARRNLHLFRLGDSRFLFHVGAKAVYSLSAEAYQDQLALVRGTAGRPEDLLDLHASCFTDDWDHNQQQTDFAALISRFPEQVNKVYLYLTTRCNMRCSYCFVPHDGRDMDLATARTIIDRTVGATAPRKVEVRFFGGEPLLRFDLLRQIVDYCQSSYPAKQFGFYISTNGVLLDKAEIIDYLAAHGVHLKVSMDGDPVSHDRFRRFPGGRGSYAQIRSNLEALLRSGYPRLTVAITLTRHHLDLDRYLDTLLSMGIQSLRWQLVAHPELAVQQEQVADLAACIRALGKRYLRDLLEGAEYDLTNFTHLFREIVAPRYLPARCTAGITSCSVDGEGQVQICQRFVGDRATSLGSIDRSLDLRALSSMLGNAESLEDSPCRRCWIRLYCHGGCYYNNYKLNGDVHRPWDPFCTLFRAYYEVAIYLVHGLQSRGRLDQLRTYLTNRPFVH